MNPKEFVSILVDAKNEFENWYNTQEKDTNKEDMESAYLAAYSTILAKISLLLGDNLYSSGKCSIQKLQGQTLHAKTIGFIHPSTNEYMEFSAPLPEYFVKLLTKLKNMK